MNNLLNLTFENAVLTCGFSLSNFIGKNLVNLFALRMSHSLFTTEDALIGTQGFSPEQILTPSNSQVKHFQFAKNMKKSFFFNFVLGEFTGTWQKP